jgi:hypothetical protein
MPATGPTCVDLQPRREFGSWRCPGPAGYAVTFFDEGNVVSVAFGIAGRERALVEQDLMWQGAGKVFGDKVEWRLRDGRPFAAIIRIWCQDGDDVIEELLVAKVEMAGSCRVGAVDVRRREANVAARELADSAVGFRCGRDPPSTVGR